MYSWVLLQITEWGDCQGHFFMRWHIRVSVYVFESLFKCVYLYSSGINEDIKNYLRNYKKIS